MIASIELHLTSMQDWQGCGHRFELTELRGAAPQSRSPKAINGTAIHRVIDQVHKHNLWEAGRDTIAEFYAAAFREAIDQPARESEVGVEIAWGEHLDAATAQAAFAGDALAMIDGYRVDVRNRLADLIVSECEWRATFASRAWAGRIDQARRLQDGTVQVVDLKSGAEKISATALQLWMQGLGYSVALENAEFRHIGNGNGEWKPLHLPVSKVTWLHLRDYIPYLRGGKTKNGGTYKAGDHRGPAFYNLEVTDQAKRSVLREMQLFSDAVEAGRFERRPSVYQCSRCKVTAACLREFGVPEGATSDVEVNGEDYE
jgi:RecB family exonuclease